MNDEEKTREELINELVELRHQVARAGDADKMQQTLAAVLDNLPEGIVVTGLDGRITYVNKSTERLTGYSRNELLGNYPGTLNAEEKADLIQQEIIDSMQNSQIWHGELLQKRKDGPTYIAEFDIFPVESNQGSTIAWTSIQRDITKNKRSEESLREQQERLQEQLSFAGALNRIAETIIINDDIQSILEAMSEIIGKALGVDRSLIYDIDFERNLAIGLCEWLNPETPGITATRDTYNLDVFINGAKYMWSRQYPFSFRKQGYYCLAFNQLNYRRNWRKEELEFVKAAAKLIEIAIQKIYFFSERKRAEEAVKAERQRLFSLLDGLPAIVYLQAPDYSIRFSNRYFWERFGKPGRRLCYEILHGREEPCKECPTFRVFDTKNPLKWESTESDGRNYQFYSYPFSDIDGSPLVLVLGIDITDRKRAEEALIESEERYRVLFNSGNDAVFVHGLTNEGVPGKFLEVNDVACQKLGYTREELLEIPPADIYTAYNQERTFEVMEKLLADKHVIFERENITKDGRKIPVEISSHLFEFKGMPTMLSITRDVTQRNQAEKALRLSEERFSKAFNTSPNPMVISTFKDGRYIEINDIFLYVTGYHREEVIGRTATELNLWAKPEDRAIMTEILKNQGTARNLELNFRIKSGELRVGLLSAEPIDLNGEQCILIVVNDITERKQLEEEMARLDRMNMVGQMAAGIGHEIRNPMTTVRGFLQMLGGKEECKKYKGYYDLMIEEMDRANSIITEFLSLAKNKAIDLKEQNLASIITALSPLIRADAMRADKYVKIEMEDIPDLLLDEKEIRQLILNFVRNGLEAMPSGGNLTIKTFVDGDEVVLAVQDQGAGIEPDILEKMGTPFFTTKDNGTGLGLAVCYSIAARHNAAIKIDTSPSGTTFLVRFKPTPGHECKYLL